MEMFCKSLTERTIEIFNLKNEVINKRTAGIIWKKQNSVVFVKNKLKINILKIKSKVNLGTIVIIQMNIEMLHMTHVI